MQKGSRVSQDMHSGDKKDATEACQHARIVPNGYTFHTAVWFLPSFILHPTLSFYRAPWKKEATLHIKEEISVAFSVLFFMVQR